MTAARTWLRRAALPLLIGGALLYVGTWLVEPSLYAYTVLGLAPLQLAVGGLGLWLDASSERAPLRVALILMATMAVARHFAISWG